MLCLMNLGLLNKVHVRVNSDKTPYELQYGNTPTVKNFKVFGRKCYIKNNDEKLGKFEPRAAERIFLGYSFKIKEYKCYNKRLRNIVESIDVVIDESLIAPKRKIKTNEDDDDEFFPSSNNNNI